jgi:peptidoglycan/LPS O-acetylase OafA/YrhL
MIQLDILRAFAVVIVLGHHFVHSSEQSSVLSWRAAGPLLPVSLVFHRFGWTGVDLFFVLSGFLIGGLLFAEIRDRGSLDVRRFLIRRGFKIWPSYYLYVLFLAVAFLIGLDAYWFPHRSLREVAVEFWPSLVNLQNYFQAPFLRTHVWTLAVEEHFYLALPLVLLAALWMSRGREGNRLRIVPILAVVLGIACLAGRCWQAYGIPDDKVWLAVVEPTHLRIESLFFGVFLAYVHVYHLGVTRFLGTHRLALSLVGVALVAPAFLLGQSRFMMTVGTTLLYLGYGCILLAAVLTPLDQGRLGQILSGRLARGIAFVGMFSYPIYLWHMDLGLFPVIRLIRTEIFSSLPPWVAWNLYLMVYFVAAIVAGMVMSIIVERPALALRDRLFPSRSRMPYGKVTEPGMTTAQPENREVPTNRETLVPEEVPPSSP